MFSMATIMLGIGPHSSLFSFYERIQRIRGFAIMRYMNLLLTLTLTLAKRPLALKLVHPAVVAKRLDGLRSMQPFGHNRSE